MGGTLFVWGGRTGIAITDEDTDGYTSVDFGPFEAEFSVKDSETGGIAIGDLIYFHDAAQMLNNTAASGRLFGAAMEAVADGETATIRYITRTRLPPRRQQQHKEVTRDV